MKLDLSRRSFLANTSKTGIALSLGGSALLSACSGEVKGDGKAILATSFSQTPLRFDFGALEPHIDGKTMEIHYTKHAAGYAKKLGLAVAEEQVDTNTSLEEILAKVSGYSTSMRNNGGGHYNHELFWHCLSPDGAKRPEGALAEAIQASFGSFEAFTEKFETAAKTRFGSGWAWLVLGADNTLAVGSTPNQDNPLMDISEFKGVPLLGLDVWEHAYYLHYQNRRAEYVSAFWSLVNWKLVAERFAAAS